MEPFNEKDNLIFEDKVETENYEQVLGLEGMPTQEDNFAKPIESTNFRTGVLGWRLGSNGKVEINGNVPAAANSYGIKGTVAFSSTHIYYCVANNTWKRVAISTW